MFATFFRTAALIAVTVTLSSASFAQERATRAEAKAMAIAAVSHVKKVGPDQAYKDFTDQSKAEWQTKDLYVLAYNSELIHLAHGQNPKRVGKSAADVKDPNGKFFVREFAEAAKHGGGWVTYEWIHPDTKKLEAKASYVQRIDGTDAFLAVGVYESK